ncbi:hypothetical protein HOT65_gp113 [Salmonella phage S133]|uniref:Uncharacterized protein n=2 Tax=Epseptimavirus TaxID=2732017 RepID=A0A2Z5HPG8_9CAUD|nr:hypothetical protein HOT60_gp113 [Salmonella phage S114]YP_009805853.1 hypothetical protein HOT65_gp113 [Salmonella phage S133]AXC40312.1 hypothetical protein [Salmonella phage S114]AXC42044.1 hypothetical protein [Salmonella phage S133]EDV1300480.1 hypothetical protein [Salmonella enterica subsp. enterica serovar Hadar]
MEREERYVVIKLSDIEKAIELGHITQSNFTTLEHILSKLWYSRAQRGKEDLKTVVVEHDWPEYEEVWKMLENRVDFEQARQEELDKGYQEAKEHHEIYDEIFKLRGISSYCQGWNKYAEEVL